MVVKVQKTVIVQPMRQNLHKDEQLALYVRKRELRMENGVMALVLNLNVGLKNKDA